MTTEAKDQRPLTPRQERRWMRVCMACLLGIFALGAVLWPLHFWRSQKATRAGNAQIMNPSQPDPGVTAADPQGALGTPVEVGMYVDLIPSLSIREANWSVVFDVWFRWKGDLPSPADALVVVGGTIESREKLAGHSTDGVHYERHRIEATFSKEFSVTGFPRDSHLLVIAVENGEMPRNRLVFVPDLDNSSVSSRVGIPGYKVADWSVIEKAHAYKTSRGDPRLSAGTKSTYSQFRLGMTIQREGWGLYLKMFQALYIAVAIALLACFIKPTDVDPRFGLGIGGLFAAVANAYLVNGFVPDTGEVTFADAVNLIGTMTILMTLIESTVSLYLFDRRGEEALSARLDRLSFAVMASGFVVANGALCLAFW